MTTNETNNEQVQEPVQEAERVETADVQPESGPTRALPAETASAREAVTEKETAADDDASVGKTKKSIGREILEWVIYLGAAVLVALAIRTFVFEPVRVDGASMAETLQDGEVMIVTKPEYVFGGNPQRGDVVICHYPERGGTNFVKRVVAIPGDEVAVKDGYLYLNGELQPEEFLTYRPNYTLAPYTVPEGKYFVLGDNRSNSNDSHLVGPLDRNMIVGHVRWVVYPFNRIRGVE